jgi:hypothetical protein
MSTFLDSLIGLPIDESNREVFFVCLAGEESVRLPDISYNMFSNFVLSGYVESEKDYYDYLHKKKMIEITDLNADAVGDMLLMYEDGFTQRRVVFKAIYDSDRDNLHFGKG